MAGAAKDSNPKGSSFSQRIFCCCGSVTDPGSTEHYHTKAIMVGDLVVGTETVVGDGPDTLIVPRGASKKEASFQAKQIQYA